MQCNIKRFDPDTLKPHRITLIIARRGSGKSTLMRDLLYHQRDRFDFVLGMCPTMESANFMRSCMPAACVYDRYVPSKVDKLVATQQTLVAKGKKRSVLLVLDDVLYDKQVMKTLAMRNIFFNGRNYYLTMICCAQYCVDLGPDLRAQVDYVCLLKENSVSNRIKLWKFFFGMFEQYNDFAAVMDKCTQNFESLILDNTLSSNAITDCIFWYKAKLQNDPFRLGKDIFYSWSDQAMRDPMETLQLQSLAQESSAPCAGGSRSKRTLQVVKESNKEENDDER